MTQAFNHSFREWLQKFEGRRGSPREGTGRDSEGVLDGVSLAVRPDAPDLRDWRYRPTLNTKRAFIEPRSEPRIINDQGKEGACTGMALAAVVDRVLLTNRTLDQFGPVSPRMLYEMARVHDEWDGENYEGSSLRGAIKGFSHNGVCSREDWPYREITEDMPQHLVIKQRRATTARVQAAKRISLGTYYRLDPEMAHYHSAIDEVGALLCSAWVHEGWRAPQVWSELGPATMGQMTGEIPMEDGTGALYPSRYMHAFAVVGYTDEGFLIQNSWGRYWGRYKEWPGIALWRYEDWSMNVVDAWVLTLGVSTPQSFALRPRRRVGGTQTGKVYRPRRQDIYPNYIHVVEGDLVERGAYPNRQTDLDLLLDLIAQTAETHQYTYDLKQPRKVTKLMLFVHGGLIPIEDAARRIADMRDAFLRHGVLPIHLLWGDGPINVLFDLFKDAFNSVANRMGASREPITDEAIERGMRFGGRAIWNEIIRESERTLRAGRPMTGFLNGVGHAAARGKGLDIHIVGYSAGVFMVGEILKRAAIDPELHKALSTRLRTVDLITPTATLTYGEDFIAAPLARLLKGRMGPPPVPPLKIYALDDETERDDQIGLYGGSLMDIVARVFAPDEASGTPSDLLGCAESLRGHIATNDGLLGTLKTALRETRPSCGTSHFTVLRNPEVMNDVLRRVSGDGDASFRSAELDDNA